MPSLTAGFLQGVIADFRHEHPDVSVSLLTYNSPEVVELSATGQFDLGYAMTPIARDRGSSPQSHWSSAYMCFHLGIPSSNSA